MFQKYTPAADPVLAVICAHLPFFEIRALWMNQPESPRYGPCESAAFVTEELVVAERGVELPGTQLGDGARSFAPVMEQARQQRLAGAGLADQDHRVGEFGDAIDLLQNSGHDAGGSDDGSQLDGELGVHAIPGLMVA